MNWASSIPNPVLCGTAPTIWQRLEMRMFGIGTPCSDTALGSSIKFFNGERKHRPANDIEDVLSKNAEGS